MVVSGKGNGRSAFSQMLLDNVSEGDLSTKLNDVPYSTDIREIITVGDMVEHNHRIETELFLKKNGENNDG